MWYITGAQGNWNKAAQILDDWGGNLTDIIGTDTSLLVGLEGDIFVNAAEIMRWEGGWVERGARAIGTTGFSNQLYWLSAKQSINIGQANYGMVSIKALLSFAVYLNDVALVGTMELKEAEESPKLKTRRKKKKKLTSACQYYNYAFHAFYNDPCAGIYANFDPSTGQGSETSRDQGHSKGAIGWAAEAARVIQSQGTDVYGEGDHLILKGSEYTANYNLGNAVPYDKKFYRCEAILVNGPWEQSSNISRGIPSPAVFDIIYYQYVVKRGMSAPWTTKMKQAIDALGGERGDGGDDHPGWGDLIWSYPGKGSFKNANNRTIWGGGRLGPNGQGNINQ